MADKLKLILTEEEMNRFFGRNGRYYIDVHRLKVIEAKKLIKKIGALVIIGEKLTVIHGYNRGAAIKEMLIKKIYFIEVILLILYIEIQGRQRLYFLCELPRLNI